MSLSRRAVRLGRKWVLLYVGAALVGALNAAVMVRAEEVERYIPASRSSRPAVLTRAEVVDIATETMGPRLVAFVLRVGMCESTFNMRATSNWPYVGLLQVDHKLHRWRVERVIGRALTLAESVDYLKNPYVNLLVSGSILEEQGVGAWPVCSR